VCVHVCVWKGGGGSMGQQRRAGDSRGSAEGQLQGAGGKETSIRRGWGLGAGAAGDCSSAGGQQQHWVAAFFVGYLGERNPTSWLHTIQLGGPDCRAPEALPH
jgi:hypothetical protein